MMLERDLKRTVMKYLKALGYFVKYHSGMGGSAGVPDIIGCFKGRFVAIELKVKPNKPTELQLHSIEAIKVANGKAIVCYTLDEVKTFIEKIEKEIRDEEESKAGKRIQAKCECQSS